MGVADEDIKMLLTGQVDSRVKGSAGNPVKMHEQFKMQRTFCVFCLKPHGYVSVDSYKYIEAGHIIVVCDDCVFTRGEPPLQKVDPKTINDLKGVVTNPPVIKG